MRPSIAGTRSNRSSAGIARRADGVPFNMRVVWRSRTLLRRGRCRACQFIASLCACGKVRREQNPPRSSFTGLLMDKRSHDEPGYGVVWPLGKPAYDSRAPNERVGDLSGKVVGELWDYLFRGEEIFPILRERLKARFPGIRFVTY